MKTAVQLIPCIFVALCLLSCATNLNAYREIDSIVKSGSYSQALEAIEKERNNKRSIYSEKNNILFYLDRGMMNHYAGFYAESTADLQEAAYLIEDAFTKSISQEAASFIANDNVKDYSGEDYEDLYINVFNALNYYHSNDIEGALVEIRRVNEKLTVLADKYERASNKVLSAAPDLANVDYKVEAVRFSNSALARYVSALLYRAKGDYDDVRIDLGELLRAYELAPAVYDHSPPSSLADEQSIPSGMARLNVIGFTGLSPVKEEIRITIPLPFPPPNSLATLALPKMTDRPSDIESMEVVLDTGQKFDLELLEDISKVAQETFKGKYGLTFVKAAARTVLKAAAGAGAAHLAKEQGGELAGYLTGLAGLIVADASEKADLRLSRYFPARALVGGINLVPGTYSIMVNYYDHGGRLIATDRQDNIVVEMNKLNLAHFVRFGLTSPS